MRCLLLSLWLYANSAYAIFSVTECENLDCPASVAEMIATRDEGDQNHCGATLIDADHMLTAYHCVPDSLKKVGAKSTDRISFSFPKTQNFNGEVLQGERIESFSSHPPLINADDLPDWAVIRLNQTTRRTPAHRRVLPWTTEGALHGFALDSNPFSIVGSLRRLDCRGVNTGYLFPLTGTGPTPLLAAGDCDREIEHGYSGSGLFDEAGNLVGLITAAVNTLAYNKNGLSNRVLLGTKTACVPNQVGALAAECDFDFADDRVQMLATAIGVLETLPDAKEPGDSVFGWAPPPPESALAKIKSFYPDIDWQSIWPILQKSTAFNEIFWREFGRAFPKLPSCVHALRPDQKESEAKLPFTLIAFGDPTLYPNENDDLMLAVDGNLKLHPQSREQILNVHLTRTVVQEQPAYSLTYAQPPGEEGLLAKICETERTDAVDNCTAAECVANPRRHRIPSQPCQEFYARKNWRRYTPTLNLTLPEC